MAAVPLFRDSNMAAVTSHENTLLHWNILFSLLSFVWPNRLHVGSNLVLGLTYDRLIVKNYYLQAFTCASLVNVICTSFLQAVLHFMTGCTATEEKTPVSQDVVKVLVLSGLMKWLALRFHWQNDWRTGWLSKWLSDGLCFWLTDWILYHIPLIDWWSTSDWLADQTTDLQLTSNRIIIIIADWLADCVNIFNPVRHQVAPLL